MRACVHRSAATHRCCHPCYRAAVPSSRRPAVTDASAAGVRHCAAVDDDRGCGGRAVTGAAAAGPACARVRRRPLCRSACAPCTRGACAGGRTRQRACGCASICPRARAREPPCRCACGRAPLCQSG